MSSANRAVERDVYFRFYAAEVSYFSAKVRPALRYKQLWFEEVRADLAEVQRRTGLGFLDVTRRPCPARSDRENGRAATRWRRAWCACST